MLWKNEENGFGAASMAMHWLTLLLIVAVYACMEFKSIYPKGSTGRDAIMAWHYMLGLLVFGLTWIRLVVRHTGDIPRVSPPPAVWQARLATTVHMLLYFLLLGLPLLGWLTLSAKGVAIPFFGLEVPALLAPDEGLADQLKEMHETIATAGYAIIGVHAAAALYHHYLLRDNTLRLMIPWR